MYFSYKKKSYKYSLLIIALLLIGIIIYPIIFSQEKNSNEEEMDAKEVNLSIEKKLTLITHYVVGSESMETRVENINSLDDIKLKFPDWKIKKVTDDEIVLEKSIYDLPPELKEGAYFSLDTDGYLTLYHKDTEENKVIETFFRIDIEKLESGLPKEPVEQLYKGIPIQDIAEYNSVLSTFSEYSFE